MRANTNMVARYVGVLAVIFLATASAFVETPDYFAAEKYEEYRSQTAQGEERSAGFFTNNPQDGSPLDDRQIIFDHVCTQKHEIITVDVNIESQLNGNSFSIVEYFQTEILDLDEAEDIETMIREGRFCSDDPNLMSATLDSDLQLILKYESINQQNLNSELVS